MIREIWFTPEPQRIEIDLGADEWAELMAEMFEDGPPESIHQLAAALSRFHLLLRATPDELLEKWSLKTRQEVAKTAREWSERLDPKESKACTGIAAQWCPIHGTCTCTRSGKPFGFEDMDDADCPLHGVDSDHPRGASGV